MWLLKVEFIVAQIDTGPVYPSTKTKLLSWICLICYRHVWTSIWYRNCLRSNLDPSSQAFVCQAMKSAQGMIVKRLRKQRGHLTLFNHPNTLPAHRLKDELQTRSAFANASKRIRVKSQAVPKRAAQVTKDILTRQKAAYEKLLRVQVAEHKKRVHEYGKRVAQQREKQSCGWHAGMLWQLIIIASYSSKRIKTPDPKYVVLMSWSTWARSFGGSSLKPGSVLQHRALIRIYWIQLPVVSRSRLRCLEMVTITGQGGCNEVVCI